MKIFFIQAGNRGAIGIGLADDVGKEVKSLQRGNPFELKVLGVLPFKDQEEAEEFMMEIRAAFSHKRIRGFWYKQDIDLKEVSNINKAL